MTGFGAKIRARGAHEVARVCRERTVDDPAENISWKKHTRLLRSDGAILEKMQVRFKPSVPWDPPAGRLHDWGWKKVGKLKPERKAAFKIDPHEVASSWKRGWLDRGYGEC